MTHSDLHLHVMRNIKNKITLTYDYAVEIKKNSPFRTFVTS